jgi:hypothetical protein
LHYVVQKHKVVAFPTVTVNITSVYLSMEVPFWIIQMSQIDLETNAAATKSMKPASAENTPGMIILRIAIIRLKKTPSIATFSADLLFFYWGKALIFKYRMVH